MPSTASSNTETAMKRWRGIIVVRSCLSNLVAQSRRGSQLRANVGDTVGHRPGNELLVVRRGEWRQIGRRCRNLDSNGSSADVIQWPQWRSKSADGNLLLLQFRRHTRSGSFT